MIKRVYGAHPLMMLSVMKPFLFVLVLPVIKGVIQYLITQKISGVLTLEIIAAAVLLLFSYLSFRAFTVSIDGKRMVIVKGLFIRRESVILREKLSSVTAVRTPADLLFGSVTYKVNTEAGASGKTDFSFKLRKRDADELFLLLYGGENRMAVRFPALKTAVFAAAASSAITGLVVGVPVINNLGRILGVALDRMLFDEISRASSRFNAYFPPAVNVLSLVLIAGYGASFFITFIKMLGFKLRVGKLKIEIEYGVFLRRHTVFKKSAVNDICIEQTPLMRLFKMFSMRAAVGGYGDKRGEKAIIVPAARHYRMKNQFRAYFSFLYPDGTPLKAERSKKSINRFLWLPRTYAAADIGLTALLAAVFPAVSRFLVLVGLFLMLLTVYYGNICYRNYKSGKLCFGERVFASGSTGLSVRELYCEKEKIGEIKIIQTPADRAYNTCKAEIIIRSESADKVRVRNLDFGATVSAVKDCFDIRE